MVRLFAVVIALSLWAAPAALAGMVDLRLGPNGHFEAIAEINGRSIAVLVDTGASAVTLSHEDARFAGLSPNTLDYDVPVATANGSVMAARVKIRRISIDGVRVDDVEGFVLPEGALKGSLLGMSFLSRLSSYRVEDGVMRLRE